MTAEIDSILHRISDTLGSQDDAIPFRRGLRQHIGDLALLRERGLTWDQIARLLTSRGVRHKRGQVVSSHQLRTVYALLVKQGLEISDNRKGLDSDRSPARQVVVELPKPSHRSPGPSIKLAEILSTRTKRLDLDE